MAKPVPLPVWDRQRGTLLAEWMDDHQPHYESEPQRSFTQWVKSQPIYDRLYALYENSRLSTREIEPFTHSMPSRFLGVLTGRALSPAGLCYSCVSLPSTTTTCTILMTEQPRTISAWAAVCGP